MPGLYRKKIEELEQTEEKVIWLLGKFTPLRENDNLLIFYYWLKVDNFKPMNLIRSDGYMDEAMVKNLTSPETIR